MIKVLFLRNISFCLNDETPEPETNEPGDLSNLITYLNLLLFYLRLLCQNTFLLQNHTFVFRPIN